MNHISELAQWGVCAARNANLLTGVFASTIISTIGADSSPLEQAMHSYVEIIGECVYSQEF